MKFRILIITLLLCVGLMAENDDIGTTGFAFLKTNYSARAAAMADAYTGLSNDANAVFFNTAGLGQLTGKQASVSYMNYFDEIQTGSAVYAIPLNPKTSIATFLKYMNGNGTRTLSNAAGDYLGTSGTFGFSNTVVGFGASRYINDMLHLGVNVKFLLDILDNNTASGIATDLSLIHQTTNKNLKLGVAIKNLGKQISSYTDSNYTENFPNIICVGFSYHPDEKLFATLDIYKPQAADFSGKIGLEYQLHPLLALRGGYKTNAADWKAGGDAEIFSGISMGMGLNWQKYIFDYAVISGGDLGLLNSITIS